MGQFYLIYGNDEQAVKKKAAAIAGKFTADNENICDTETIAGDAGKSGKSAQDFSRCQSRSGLRQRRSPYDYGTDGPENLYSLTNHPSGDMPENSNQCSFLIFYKKNVEKY